MVSIRTDSVRGSVRFVSFRRNHRHSNRIDSLIAHSMGGGAWPLLVGGVTCLVDSAHHTRTDTHYAGKKSPEAARPGLNLGVWVRRACVRPLGRSCVGAFFFPRGPTKPQLAQTAGPKNNLLRQNRLLFGWAVWGQGPTQKQPKSTLSFRTFMGHRPKNSLDWSVWLFLARALLQDFHGSSPKKKPRLVRLVVFSPGSPSGLSWVIAQKTA